MKLIGSLTSPYVRKVRIVLAEKKIECDFIVDSPWSEGSTAARHNPLGKVPILILEDDSVLYDSRVIAEYLDTLAPNNRLFPAMGRERITVKRWEALADGICDAAADALLESRRPENEKSPSWIARQQQKMLAGVQALAHDLAEHPWCHGKGLSMADIATGCALGYLSFRHPQLDWRQYDNLAQLYDKLMQRPSFADSVPHD